MEVILLHNIENVGSEGDTVKVKDGYARNYLIPRKLAMPYSANAVKVLEAKRKREAALQEKAKVTAKELAKTVSQLSLTIPVESGVNDTLFGSVTSEVISHALRNENIHIDKKSITLPEPIKKLGIYNVEVSLHPEVKETLRVWVVKK